MLVLPTRDQVMLSLLSLDGGYAANLVPLRTWARGLAFAGDRGIVDPDHPCRRCSRVAQDGGLCTVCSGRLDADLTAGASHPWVTDLWVWLPLGVPGSGETKETGRYYLHAQTCRIYDTWQGTWCRSNWGARKNSPRVSVQWNTPTLEWVQLGKVLATTAESPAQRKPAEDVGAVAGGASQLWALAVEPDHAAMLRGYEVQHGPGTGCFDVYAFRWTRHGHPSPKSTKYPYTPLPEYCVDPVRA